MLSSLSPEIKTNKLNIFLLKDIVKSEQNAIKGTDVPYVDFKKLGKLFYYRSKEEYPDWIDTFFLSDSLIDKNHFKVLNSKAVLITKIKVGKKDRFFAIPFGLGRFLLKDGIYVERFGLRTTLNLLQNDAVKSIGKKTLSANTKQTIEQLAKQSKVGEFQIDIEQDIVNSITGKSTSADFGNMLTGKDSLSVSSKVNITNLQLFLQKCIKAYDDDKYKEKFEWIDFIKEVNSKSIIDGLDKTLIGLIKTKSEHVWLSIPDIINWEDFKGFKYSTKKTDENIYQDLLMKDLVNSFDSLDDVDVETLEKSVITAWSEETDSYFKRWTTYKCLNAEVHDGKGKKYQFDNGKWYEVDSDFVRQVDEYVKRIKQSKLDLIDFNHSDENSYNKALESSLIATCVDKNNISYGKGHSKIEFCDVLTKDRNLLFVKKYSSSAAMSHLFSQGFVTAELMLYEGGFRDAVIKILPDGFKSLVPSQTDKFDQGQFTLTYVIISKKKNQQLPFFSKVNLRNFHRRLTSNGYKVEVKYVKYKH